MGPVVAGPEGIANHPRSSGGIAAPEIAISVVLQSIDRVSRSAISEPGSWRSTGKARTVPVRNPPGRGWVEVMTVSVAGIIAATPAAWSA